MTASHRWTWPVCSTALPAPGWVAASRSLTLAMLVVVLDELVDGPHARPSAHTPAPWPGGRPVDSVEPLPVPRELPLPQPLSLLLARGQRGQRGHLPGPGIAQRIAQPAPRWQQQGAVAAAARPAGHPGERKGEREIIRPEGL